MTRPPDLPTAGHGPPVIGIVAAVPPHAPLAAALTARDLGYACVPIRPFEKVPAVAWGGLAERTRTRDGVAALFRDPAGNVAVLTGPLVVFDCDDPAQAERVTAACGDTPYRVLTPRGGLHLGYRTPIDHHIGNRVRVGGVPLDVRGARGLALIPPSRTAAGAYRWATGVMPPLTDLPEARLDWLTEADPPRVAVPLPPPPPADEPPERFLRRVGNYVAKLDPAVSGQGGHNACFRAACRIVALVGGDADWAWHFLCRYSETCRPPWSEAELRHKLADALKAHAART